MLLPLVVLAEIEATISAIAIGVSLRGRRRAETFGATALSAAAIALAGAFVWILWLVAPACMAGTSATGCIGSRASGAAAFGLEIALLQWFWMLGLALGARFVSQKNLAHVLD